MEGYDFANILFSGPCNLVCPDCIGGRLVEFGEADNLDRYPLAGQREFIAALRRFGIRQVSLTGTNTDPSLYRHQVQLIAALRDQVPGVRLSLHTNGRRALRRSREFNLYDRATISLPSFDPCTYLRMTGRRGPIDLQAIVRESLIPLKISVLVTEHNMAEIPEIIDRCRGLGIRRLVLRTLYGETRERNLLQGFDPVASFAGNPVYDVRGMEVTVWDFVRSRLRCLNLFADGTIGAEYELTRNAS